MIHPPVPLCSCRSAQRGPAAPSAHWLCRGGLPHGGGGGGSVGGRRAALPPPCASHRCEKSQPTQWMIHWTLFFFFFEAPPLTQHGATTNKRNTYMFTYMFTLNVILWYSMSMQDKKMFCTEHKINCFVLSNIQNFIHFKIVYFQISIISSIS
jgi:hypothetical protein